MGRWERAFINDKVDLKINMNNSTNTILLPNITLKTINSVNLWCVWTERE